MHKKLLEGLKVIDIATMMAAPWAATYLGDFGAEVIKVEHPQKGDTARLFGAVEKDVGLFWKTLSRNKKAITLNLNSNEGRELFLKILQDADVLIENFRPGTMDKWGLSWETLHKANPRLIILRVSAFGQEGPYRERAGFGTIAEGMSGFAAQNGYPDSPPTLPPLPLADGICSIFSAFCIMAAVHERDVLGSNIGQEIDISLYEPIMRMMELFILEYDITGSVPGRVGNRLPAAAPRNVYRTKDEKWVALSASNQPIAEKLFKLMNREDLIYDSRFSDNPSRVKNVDLLDDVVGKWIASKDRDEVLTLLNKAGAPVGPIYEIADLFDDPHYLFRNSLIQLDDKDFGKITMPNVVAKFSRTPGAVSFAGQEKGAQNDEVYQQLGLSREDIQALKEKGIV